MFTNISTIPYQASVCHSLLPNREEEGVSQKRNVIGRDCSEAHPNSATTVATGVATDVIVTIPDTSLNTVEINKALTNNVEKKKKWRKLRLLKIFLFKGIILMSILGFVEVFKIIYPMLWIKDPRYVDFLALAFIKGSHTIIFPYLIVSTPEIKVHAYNSLANYAKAICNFFDQMCCSLRRT